MSITVRGPGRCTECCFYVALQGHREGCSRTAPVTPGEADFGANQKWAEVDERAKREGVHWLEARLRVAGLLPPLPDRDRERRWKAFTAPVKHEGQHDDKRKGSRRNRALGVLRKVEAELSSLGVNTSRDQDSNKETYSLGRFVNDGALTRDDVHDMIIRSAYANGHYPDNKSIEQIEKDIDRALDDAKDDGNLPDWGSE